jgi:small subunit ribosomal protein S16
MVRIRLRRVGAKKQPSFRVVAADKEAPRDGRFIENLGFYNPRTEPATISLKEDRIFEWISKGAQMSDSVERICKSIGTLDRYERFKAGEDIDVLLEEAKTAEDERNVDPRTMLVVAPKKKTKQARKPEEVVEKIEEKLPEGSVEEESTESVEEVPEKVDEVEASETEEVAESEESSMNEELTEEEIGEVQPQEEVEETSAESESESAAEEE